MKLSSWISQLGFLPTAHRDLSWMTCDVRRIDRQGQVFPCVRYRMMISADHSLRPMKNRLNKVLSGRSRGYSRYSSANGRTDSQRIPPERVIKTPLRCALYTIRFDSDDPIDVRIAPEALAKYAPDLSGTCAMHQRPTRTQYTRSNNSLRGCESPFHIETFEAVR